MGRIKNSDLYPIKNSPVSTDTVIGTDSENQGKTVQFKVGNLGGDAEEPPFPFMNISFGDSNNGDALNREFYYENRVIVDEVFSDDIPIKVYKIIVDIPQFEEFSQYQPVLLVDRYRKGGKITQLKDRKSGFKHENEQDAIDNGRSNEIPLTGARTIVDINPETYFRIRGRDIIVKSWGTKISNNDGRPYNSFNVISLRLRLTIGDKVFESNSLRELRVVLFMEKINPLLDSSELDNYIGKIRYRLI